jgi:epoxyqueuosine reductase
MEVQHLISVAEIKKYGAEIGLDIVQVASAEPFPEYINIVQNRIENGFIPSESQDAEDIFRRVEFYSKPENSLAPAKSIISLGMPYLIKGEVDRTKPGVPCGIIGRHYWRDFYGELWRKKARLVRFLERKGIRCSKEAYLPHKLVAQRAGVGFYGKNCLIQTRDFGSWILLVSIVTNANFELDGPSPLNCGSCEACMKACPTHAIVAPYTLNIGRCINHLLASTEPIPIELRPLIGNRINSCDCCQEVCPQNRNVPPVKRKFRNPRKKWGTSPALIQLLDISEKEFKQSFADLDWYRPELRFLQRNAIVALGNIGDPASLSALSKMLRNQESIIRAHTAWAIGRIGGPKAKRLLHDAFSKEKDVEVKKEIENALQILT